MQFPKSSYRHVSYNKQELLMRQKQEARLMELFGIGYSGLVKKSIDTLDHLIATKHLV
tara:strand:+ start:202 stop:375 length:174 start_codon:yes stop_codon:yes gene_type:complete